MKSIPDKSIDMILCDLPYGTTSCRWDTVIDFNLLWEQYERVIKDHAAIVLTADQPFTSYLITSNISLYRYNWTWKKSYTTGFMNANKMPLKCCEDICVFYKKLPTYNPQGVIESNKKCVCKKDKDTTIYNDMRLKEGEYTQKYTNYPKNIVETTKKEKTVHPTQKPVELFEYLIKTYTKENEVVLDNCAGSGTTGEACKNLNRNCILIEKEDQYCKIIEERLNIKRESVTFYNVAS
jgi:site-specific DNA-methyltransferase (adenine-specific)